MEEIWDNVITIMVHLNEVTTSRTSSSQIVLMRLDGPCSKSNSFINISKLDVLGIEPMNSGLSIRYAEQLTNEAVILYKYMMCYSKFSCWDYAVFFMISSVSRFHDVCKKGTMSGLQILSKFWEKCYGDAGNDQTGVWATKYEPQVFGQQSMSLHTCLSTCSIQIEHNMQRMGFNN